MAATVVATILSAIAAIMLGVNHSQVWAVIFWGLSLAGCIATWLAYRRYSSIRQVRWRAELSRSEQELGSIFEQSRPDVPDPDSLTTAPDATTGTSGGNPP